MRKARKKQRGGAGWWNTAKNWIPGLGSNTSDTISENCDEIRKVVENLQKQLKEKKTIEANQADVNEKFEKILASVMNITITNSDAKKSKELPSSTTFADSSSSELSPNLPPIRGGGKRRYKKKRKRTQRRKKRRKRKTRRRR